MQLNNALRKVLITLKDYVDKMTPKKLSDLDIDIDLNSVKTINGQSPDENGNIEIETIVSWDELQNKPFDEEYSNIYYLEEQTVNIEEHSDLHQAWIDIPLNDLVYRDNKYTVVFDGIEYEATLYDAEGGAFIGINYYYPSDNRDNLPFGLWFSHFASKDNELYGLSQLAAICTTDDSLIGEHTISIYAEGLSIHHLDPKYIKDMYYKEINEVEVLPQSSLLFGYSAFDDVLLPTPLIEGSSYTINWNGTEYECVARISEWGVCIENTDVPFYIETINDGDLYTYIETANTGSHTISIYNNTDSVEVLPETSVELNDYIVERSNELNEMLVEGSEYTVNWNGTEYKCIAYGDENEAYIGNTALYGDDSSESDEPFFILTNKLANYSLIIPSEEGTHDIHITGKVKTIHKIDREYLSGLVGISGTGEKSEIFNDYRNNIASGSNSHAEGSNTIASGSRSHAEGSNTIASGANSHAEGSGTTASGYSSHAEGSNTIASGYSSHAEGDNTTASGSRSHAEGCGKKITLSLTGNANTTTYTVSSNNSNIKVGRVLNYGNTYAMITSYNKSTLTITTDKTLDSSNALSNTTVNLVLGIASGYYSHAEGSGTTASGHYSHAEGSGTTASGANSHAEGSNTIASGANSHAEGSGTTASGANSHAEGDNTTASGNYSHAEGYSTEASDHSSHAEGYYTKASGDYSHAEGNYTKASGDYSHAEGSGTVASGNTSHAEGQNTKASGDYQHVQGKYNIDDVDADGNPLNNYAYIVGNGTSNSSRSNAHTLDWEGNAWFSGDIYVGSTSGINKDEGSKKLATEEYVDNNINSTVAIKTFPISETYTSGIFTFARTNIFELIKNQVYHTIPVEGIDGWYLSVPCTDGTFKNICLLSAGSEYRVLYDDTKANVYSFNDNVYYLADYTDKSTSSAVIITKTKNYYYLSTNNTTEYTPTGDYNPATKKYVDNAVANAGGGVQSDWNQNDETASDYVKNRPFGEEASYEICNTEQSFTFESDNSGTKARARASLQRSVYIDYERINIPTVVVFDGVEYTDLNIYEGGGDMCIYIEFTTESGDEVIIIENNKILMPYSYIGTTHTIEIKQEYTVVKTIDKKYLPDDVAFKSDIDNVSDTMIVNVTLDGSTYSADKTGVEIKAAIDEGKFVCAVYNKEIYYVTHCKDTNIHFQYQKVDTTGVTSKLLSCVISSNRWAYGDGNFNYGSITEVRTSSTLTTTDKTIVGAINELDSELDSHTHDDRYYTETEIDTKLSAVNTSITNITSGTTPVKEATHSSTADTATNATNAGKADLATKAEQDGNGNVIVETYETKSDALAKLAEVIALKPDWNQNDETASDYVKNRPFYTENEGEITEIVPETTFTIDNEGMWYSEKFAIPIEAGNTYICKYNGVEYICTAFSYAQDGIEGIFLGNMGKSGAVFEDTGEPFVIVTAPADNMTMVILHDGTVSTNITCSITMNNEVIHKLPNKYLDLDWKPTKEYKLTDVFPINNVIFTGKEITLIDSQAFYLHVGEEYTVNWNGTEYVCEAKRIDADPFSVFYIGNSGLTTLTGKVDTGEPFIYWYLTDVANSVIAFAKLTKEDTTTETVSISVKGYTDVYNKIPTNFLPDSYVIPTDIDAGLVINELKLADKAFQEGRRVYARKGGVFGQVIYLDFDSVDGIFNQMWFVSDSKMFYIWSYEYGSTNGVAKTNYIVVGLVPDISGTMGYSVPVPSEMKAGQMVRLKSIDESKASGYNMAWEAVDPWVIESSTAGSTKKFKLTVDDSGTISTTEVTE